MLNSLTMKSPGKLVLAGEYAVVYGHLGLVCAIDRFAKVIFTKENFLKIDKGSALIDSIIRIARNSGLKIYPGHYLIDTKDFFSKDNQKLGLGSSAAVCAAFIKLIYYLNHKRINKNEIYLLALKAHLDFSKDLGSGIDIAASVYGNSLLFPHNNFIKINNLWENLLIIHTNISQDTREYLYSFNKAFNSNKTEFKKLFLLSDNIIKELIDFKFNYELTKSAFSKFFEILYNLGKKSKINIISKPHEEINDLAHKFGGASKPSGAGGGDFSLVLLKKELQQDFINALEKYPYRHFDLRPF